MVLAEAALALRAGHVLRAEHLARSILAADTSNVEAIRLLAGVASATAANEDAERMLQRAIALAPDFILAYADLTSLLCRLNRAEEAITLLDEAAQRYRHDIWPLSIKAAVLSAERLDEEAVQAHQAVVALAPDATIPWTNYAHALKTVGRTNEAVSAYRKSVQLDPGNGSAWWGLANLRTVRLNAQDVALMEGALPKLHDPSLKVQLHFALGKALGDTGDYERSFRQYEEANRLRGQLVPYDAASTGGPIRRSEAIFGRDFFAHREGQGYDAGDVIFIIGMPRSGSTLVEQILASHPAIEGTGELFELRDIASRTTDYGGVPSPESIAELSIEKLRSLGEEYMRSTRRYRRTDRPFFTDKMPSNWQLVPLIHLILPNAKIIDVRRNPLACCLSSFGTYFNRRTSFPADMKGLARYYRDYVRFIDHMDAVLPGSIHRVYYEQIVEDLETEVRRLLDFIGLPFNQACLRFPETQRAVHTPSAQQVRRPLNRDGLDYWRNYERWLTPVEEIERELEARELSKICTDCSQQ